MIKELIRIANSLDSKGLAKEADYLDAIIRKIALSTPGLQELLDGDDRAEFGAERTAVDPMAFLYKNRHPYAETTAHYSYKLEKWVYIPSDIAQKHNLSALDTQYRESQRASEEEQTKIYNSYNHALGQAIIEYGKGYNTHEAWTERQRSGEGDQEFLGDEQYWLDYIRSIGNLLFGEGDILASEIPKTLGLPTPEESGVDPDADEETLEDWTERQRTGG